MAALNDYRCAAHGAFESREARCPYGCPASFVKIEFNQAPAYHNGRTRNIDRTLRGIAADHGLTDMKNDPKGGKSVMESLRSGKIQQSKWLNVDHAEPGFSRRGEPAPVFNPAGIGFQPPERPMVADLPKPAPKYQARWDGK
jgi:hypothetical protein